MKNLTRVAFDAYFRDYPEDCKPSFGSDQQVRFRRVVKALADAYRMRAKKKALRNKHVDAGRRGM